MANEESNGKSEGAENRFLLEPGLCLADPKEGVISVAKSGRPQYVVNFCIADGQNIGKFIRWYGGMAGDGQEWTLKTLETLGWDLNKVPLEKFIPMNKVQLMIETITDKNDSTKKFSSVKYVNAIGGGAIVRLDEAKERSVVASFTESAKALKSAKKDQGSSADANSFGSKSPSKEDDLPF